MTIYTSKQVKQVHLIKAELIRIKKERAQLVRRSIEDLVTARATLDKGRYTLV